MPKPEKRRRPRRRAAKQPGHNPRTPGSATATLATATQPPEADAERARRPHKADLLRVLGALVVIVIAAFLGTRSLGPPDPSADPTEAASRVIVGTPGGGVFDDAVPTPTPSPHSTQSPAPSPTAQATPDPVATAAPTVAAPAPTPVPDPTLTPAVAPASTPVLVAAAGPVDSVAGFYGAVVDGRFDAAYSHWSDRMRSTYPRRENLDERFDNTAQVTFHQLHVAEMAGGSATVQANFTETDDSGSSREFIGYWRLVQIDGRWLLDEPHY